MTNDGLARFNSSLVLEALHGFQRDAVAHVTDRFFGKGKEEGSGRFLIADETGLGKSIIARGIIAETISHLECDDTVHRIDIVYICSNSDLARQNLQRLNITGRQEIAMATRLSLLATQSRRLKNAQNVGTKPVNLVSFTPGTSFTTSGRRQGNSEERALLTLLLDDLLDHNHAEQRITRLLMQGTVTSFENFVRHVENLQNRIEGPVDKVISDEFFCKAKNSGALAEFVRLRDEHRYFRRVRPELDERVKENTGNLRQCLSAAGVSTLQPDLIILDEFQRFKDLLDPESGLAAELAHELFGYGSAKVLLLSATPYTPFTRSEDENDHHEDFIATVKFLAGDNERYVLEVADALNLYRRSAISGEGTQNATERIRELLSPIMSRSERPTLIEQRDLIEVERMSLGAPTPEDLYSWHALTLLARALGTNIPLEYWKSVPCFANVMNRYEIGKRFTQSLETELRPDAVRALAGIKGIKAEKVRARAPIDPGNARMRALMQNTVGAGWWKLLWLPASMPYLKPGPIYKSFEGAEITKLTLFSTYAGTPVAVSSLLNHEAERLMHAEVLAESGDAHLSDARFRYATSQDRATGMSTLAMFWPHPELARLGDQLDAARNAGDTITTENLIADIESRLPKGETARQAWHAFFSVPGAFTFDLDAIISQDYRANTERGGEEHSRRVKGLRAVINEVQNFLQDDQGRHPRTALTHPDLSRLIAFAPGNLAYRAVTMIAGSRPTDLAKFTAAWIIADAIRSLFNRNDSAALIDQLIPNNERHEDYWQRVLAYCADGNLRAVLDEYLFQLWSDTGKQDIDDDSLIKMATNVADAILLRPERHELHEATIESAAFSMTGRFAMSYGHAGASNEGASVVHRLEGVRRSFNSPFAPFVLASTSVGQEGIDFHWWSHAVLHWNLPSNPVDFEQREGRVNRYGGHAVRKNVALAHKHEVLCKEATGHPWEVAFEAASQIDTGLGEFSPWWVYPGPSRIRRVLAEHPMSRDLVKYERLRSELTLYRLTLGQPRQADMIEILAQRGVDGAQVPKIDLSPPKR